MSTLDSSGNWLDDVLDTKLFNDLRHRMGSQPDALDALYRRFLSNSGKLISTLRDQESTARQHTLHTLKGNAAMLGAKRLAALADRVQHENPHPPALLAEAIEGLETELEFFRHVVATRVALDPPNQGGPV